MYEHVGLCFRCLLLGLFSICWVSLSRVNEMGVVVSCFLFCHAWLYSLRNLLFLSDIHKIIRSLGEKLGGEGNEEE